MKKLLFALMVAGMFLVPVFSTAQIPDLDIGKSAEKFKEYDINAAYLLAEEDSDGVLFKTFMRAANATMPQQISVLTILDDGVSRTINVIEVEGVFAEIVELWPLENWLHFKDGIPTLCCASPSREVVVRLIHKKS